MHADKVHHEDSGSESGERTGPRHAAPRKPLFTRLQMPAGKAIALAAMPTAVLMGMGLTPTLAQAKSMPKNPFQDGPCVTQPDESPTDANTADKNTADKNKADKKDDADKAKSSASPTPSASSSASPTPTASPKAASTPAPSASASSGHAGSGGLLGGLGGALGGLLTGGQQASAQPSPSASSSSSAKDSGSAVDKVTGAVGDTVDKVTGTAKDVTDGVGDTVDQAAKAAGKAKDATAPSPSASSTPGANGQAFPCVVEKKSSGTDETPPVQIPNDPWHLEASSLLLQGLHYEGVVNLRMPNGQTKQALKYTAKDGIDIGDLHQILTGPGGKQYHVQAAQGSTSTIRNGTVTLYTESLAGNLFGVIPITFDPEHPPPIDLPTAYFTNVKLTQAGQFGGTLTIPGLHQYITD